MKKFLVLSVLACSSLLAQETPPPAPEPNSAETTAAQVLNQLTAYLMQNGSIGTGYGMEWGMASENRGVTLNYCIEAGPKIHLWKLESRLALGYNTTFSEPVNRQHLFLAVPVYWFKLPPWLGEVVNTPKTTLASGPGPTQTMASLWPNLASWKIQPAIGLRPEDIYNMEFNYKRIFFGMQYMVSFM